MSLPNPVKAHYPGEIWETHTGGPEVVVSSRLYDEGPFGTVITAAIAAEPGHFRPFIATAGAFASGVRRPDRADSHRLAHPKTRRPRPAVRSEVDRHLATLFLR
jgi:hypothetical protein